MWPRRHRPPDRHPPTRPRVGTSCPVTIAASATANPTSCTGVSASPATTVPTTAATSDFNASPAARAFLDVLDAARASDAGGTNDADTP